MKYLNIENWNRRDHFKFFGSFEEPFFGICVNVDVTNQYETSKKQGTSFYISYLHKSLLAANVVEPFKYRTTQDGRIAIYDDVGASATVLRDDDTFGFSYIKFDPDFSIFSAMAYKEIERVKNNQGLEIDVAPPNVIQFSTLPWFNFTSLSHARSFSHDGSNPMISYGKVNLENGRRYMPVSIHVHHGLMDGIHVGKFVTTFQELLNQQSL